MRLRPLAIVLALATLVAPVATACGDDADDASESETEEVVGGEVDIDEGTVRITDEDGTVSEFGPTSELPEEWPPALVPPDSVTLSGATRQTTDGVTSLVAFGEAQGTVDDYLAGLESQFAAAGLEVGDRSRASGSGTEFATVSGTGPDYDATATITAEDGSDVVTISLSITLAT